MKPGSDSIRNARIAAARHAATLVADGMSIGLGSGSTAAEFVRALGERVRGGLRVQGVPTSDATAALARAEQIPLTTLEDHPRLDLAVDGADAVDPALAAIKGLGGALLREKIVASAAARFVVIIDEAKLVPSFTSAQVVPVEVVTFGWSRTLDELDRLGVHGVRRMHTATDAYVTDNGNYILDCHFDDLSNAAAATSAVKLVTGVVEHGLFVAMASDVIVGSANGSVRRLTRA